MLRGDRREEEKIKIRLVGFEFREVSSDNFISEIGVEFLIWEEALARYEVIADVKFAERRTLLQNLVKDVLVGFAVLRRAEEIRVREIQVVQHAE